MIVVDRIEDGYAVLEIDGAIKNFPLNELPDGIHEGTLLVKTENGYVIDEEGTRLRRNQLAKRTRRLFTKE